MHGAEFPDVEAPILNSGPGLFVEKRPRRLQPLRQPDDDCERREKDQHDRERERKVDRPFDPAVKWILQRLLAQAKKTEAIIVEMSHRVSEFFLEVADHEQPHAE